MLSSCFFAHFSSISLPQYAAQCQDMLHRVVFFLKIRYAFLRFMVKLYLVDRHPLCTHHRCRIMLVEQRCMDHAVKSLTDSPRSLRAVVSCARPCAINGFVSLDHSWVSARASRHLSRQQRKRSVSLSENGHHHSI